MSTANQTNKHTLSEPTSNRQQTDSEQLQKKDEQGCQKAEHGRRMNEEKSRSSLLFFENRKGWTNTFIPINFWNMSLAKYSELHPNCAEQVAAAESYVADLLNGGRRTVVIYGPAGSGKTELACAIWNAVAPNVDDRHSYDGVLKARTADNVAFVPGMDLPDYWKRSGERENRNVSANHLDSVWFAVFDDLDKCPARGWNTQLQRLIDARTWFAPKPTVITMNTTPAQLAIKYGECGQPIVSRFERSGSLFLRIGTS